MSASSSDVGRGPEAGLEVGASPGGLRQRPAGRTTRRRLLRGVIAGGTLSALGFAGYAWRIERLRPNCRRVDMRRLSPDPEWFTARVQ